MPWWLYAYFAAYAVFTFLWVHHEIREGGSKPLLAAELLADGCLIVVALAYWLPSVRTMLSGYARIVFIAALSWLIVAGIRDIRESWPINDSAFEQIGTALGVLLLYGLICGPILYWGFSYAVLGSTSGI